jgi:hypothetical protein
MADENPVETGILYITTFSRGPHGERFPPMHWKTFASALEWGLYPREKNVWRQDENGKRRLVAKDRVVTEYGLTVGEAEGIVWI